MWSLLMVNKATSSLTFHNDNARSGLNSSESILAPGNVNANGFGKLGIFPVDGAVDAQPLYLSEVNVPAKGVHDILYVATENDTVIAFDAFSGAVLWRANVAGFGETPGDNSGCNPASPNAGISATPVIDRTRGPNGAIYLVAKSRDAAGNSYERLHALDVSSRSGTFWRSGDDSCFDFRWSADVRGGETEGAGRSACVERKRVRVMGHAMWFHFVHGGINWK